MSTAPTAPEQTTPPAKSGSKSKAWIAGAVVGPVIGIALVVALVFFLLRRRKNKTVTAPQSGGAAMVHNDPSQPPAGVGGYTDAKPQFVPQTQPYGQPDPYANQGAYAAQQGYAAAAPTSPAPHYTTPAPYNTTGSPPPQQNYQSDVKYGYAGPPVGGAAELGGDSNGIAPVAPAGHTAPAPPAAEMAGDSTQPNGPGIFGGAELATTTSNPQAPTRQ